MTSPHDGGEAILSALEACGAEYVFCSSGSEWAPVWEALARRHRDGWGEIQYLDLTHETVAVGMATGYGLIRRTPQGVLLHAGPGLLQGACAIHGALLAGAPMVVASSESITYGEGAGPDPGGQWYRNLSVVGGPHTLAAPFVKWSNQAAHSSTLHQLVTRAAELASRSPAGPTYLNVPLEVLLSPWDSPDTVSPISPRGGTVSAKGDVERAVDLLVEAERPVIVTESVGRDRGGMAALVELAETFDVPVIEPNSAICANFPRNHRLHAGDDVGPFMDDADLIVLIRCRAPFYPPSRRPGQANVLVVDETPHRPHMVYQVLQASQYLEGDVVATLRAMSELGMNRIDTAKTSARRVWADSLRATETEAIEAAETDSLGEDEIDPVSAVVALREVYGDEDPIFVDETITHGRLVRRHLRRTTEDSYFYVQGGLGQGIAVALGAKLSSGDRPVVLTVGDGAFLYNPIIQSLQASRDYDLPLMIVVFNNQQYRSMKLNHLRFYPEGAAVETEEFLGVDLSGQPDLSSLTEPFGMHGEEVAQQDDLVPALERARESVSGGVTAVVNVTVAR